MAGEAERKMAPTPALTVFLARTEKCMLLSGVSKWSIMGGVMERLIGSVLTHCRDLQRRVAVTWTFSRCGRWIVWAKSVCLPCWVVFPWCPLARQCLAWADGPPVSLTPLPSSSSSSSWLRIVAPRAPPHSSSHGKVPSSPAWAGRAVPNSSTHQQWPRCMPLEDWHWGTTGTHWN